MPFIDQRQAALLARPGPLATGHVVRPVPGHKAHDFVKLGLGEEGRELAAYVPQHGRRRCNAELLADCLAQAIAADILEFSRQRVHHRPVELFGLRNRH